MGKNWTPEEIELLRVLWRDSPLPASQIAPMFGVTKNSIIGKVHRLGLTSRRARRIKITPTGRTRPIFSKPTHKRPRPKAPPAPPPVEPQYLRLWELKPWQCHWPYGDGPFTFCGMKRDGLHPYCREHHLEAMRVTWADPLRVYHYRQRKRVA